MVESTHVKTGISTTVSLYTLSSFDLFSFPVEINQASLFAILAGTILGTMLPDIESTKGNITKYFPLIHKLLLFLAKHQIVACYHRHLFHSVFGFPILWGVLFVFGSPFIQALSFGLLIGTLTHIVADVFISNTWVLYPVIKKPITILGLKEEDNPVLYKKIDNGWATVFYCITLCNIPAYLISVFL